jgi:hypothetical protein
MNALIATLWQHNPAGLIASAQPPAGQPRSQGYGAQGYGAQDDRAQDYRAQDYRAQAAECQTVANRWPDDLVKQQYEELARQWRALAEHAEGRR